MSRYTDFEDSFDDDYIREINEAYWAEEEEFKLGVHPTQVLERIQERLHFDEIDFCEITFLDWSFEGSRVGAFLDGNFYGVFDYERNIFESTPDTRLNDILELNHFGLNER